MRSNMKDQESPLYNSACEVKRPSLKEEAQFGIDRALNELEQRRKLLKFVDKFPDATRFLEENHLSIYHY